MKAFMDQRSRDQSSALPLTQHQRAKSLVTLFLAHQAHGNIRISQTAQERVHFSQYSVFFIQLVQTPIISNPDDCISPPTSVPTSSPVSPVIHLPLNSQTYAVKTQVRSIPKGEWRAGIGTRALAFRELQLHSPSRERACLAHAFSLLPREGQS